MICGIDFDGTFAANPDMFRALIQVMREFGVVPIMVTQRCAMFRAEIDEALDGFKLPIVFAAGKTKEDAAREAGYTVDIWIDDNPYSISTALKYRGCP